VGCEAKREDWYYQNILNESIERLIELKMKMERRLGGLVVGDGSGS